MVLEDPNSRPQQRLLSLRVTKMAHVATLARSNKWMQNSGVNSDDDEDDFLSYDFYNTPGGKSLFKYVCLSACFTCLFADLKPLLKYLSN